MQKILKYIVDHILKDEEKSQKYIIDYGNESYGVIVQVGNRKEMYRISSNPPGLAQPKEYTFDEITETSFSNFDKLRKV